MLFHLRKQLPTRLTSDEAKAEVLILVLKKKIQHFIDAEKERAVIAIFQFCLMYRQTQHFRYFSLHRVDRS
jgi:hypothetical protein